MKLTLTTNDGTVIEQWDLDEYDFDKQFARAMLIGEIVSHVANTDEDGCQKENQPKGK
jgi:hypothetical protein